MHISLDSALGRQRRLNSVGESVFQIAPDAAAGYSLRSLTGGDPSVVRVRRESDNGERDFNASGVSSGELVNWVNQQITPPLDLRTLTATGRDGPIIEAAAAYSLRNLSDSYTGSVAEVRRTSDGAVRSFTAAEVTDGTLVTWVNESVNIKTYDFSTNAGGLEFPNNITLTGGQSAGGVDDALKMSVVSTGSNTVHRCYQNLYNGGLGSSFRITFRAYRPSSNVNSGKLGFSFASGFLASSSPSQQFLSEDDAWEDFTFTANSGNSTRFYLQLSSTAGIGGGKAVFNGTTGDHVFIKDLSIDVVSSTGTVSKWYDQSTTSGVPNANHLVQTDTAKHPKIVDGGSLVVGGLDFDGANDLLQHSHILETDDVLYVAIVANNRNINTRTKYLSNLVYISGNDNAGFSYEVQTFGQSGKIAGYLDDSLASSSTQTGSSSLTENQTQLLSFDLSSGSSKFRLDGSLISTFTTTMSSEDLGGVLQVGGNNTGSSAFDGTIDEIIIYNSDQSDNRTALEANIGEVYGIAGIPAYDDTVNGFVETWYDQSGNGNNATQLTAGNQPKIVNAGALLLRNGEPTIDFYNSSSFATSAFTDGSAHSSFSVINNQAANSTRKVFYSKSEFPNKGIVWNYRGDQTAGQYDFVSFDGDANSLLYNNTSSPLYALASTFISSSKNLFINGSSAASSSDSFVADDGNLGVGSASFGTGFDIQEIILYPSDQSANRLAIEANINNQYDIY